MQLCDIALCYALFFGMIAYTQKNIHCLLQIFFTYSNNVIDNLGVVVGADGKDGKDGADGAKGDKGADGINGIDSKDGLNGTDGVGIDTIVIENDELNITLSNGTSLNLGKIKGADGKDGINGTNGRDGINGADGQDGIPTLGVLLFFLHTLPCRTKCL